MSFKGKNAHSDHEYLSSFQQELRVLREEQEVNVDVSIRMHDTRGVLVVRMTAWEAYTSDADNPLCAYESEWPNAYTLGWPAFLFNAAVRLARLVEDSQQDAMMGAWRRYSKEG